MKAFDTDILTEILAGNSIYADRIARIPLEEQIVPIVVAEEILRGRLNSIRQAEAGKGRNSVELAYRLFEETLDAFRETKFLSLNENSETVLTDWRKKKVKGSTHDLRIAAIYVAHAAILVTRNRRDFEKIPGLSAEYWD